MGHGRGCCGSKQAEEEPAAANERTSLIAQATVDAQHADYRAVDTTSVPAAQSAATPAELTTEQEAMMSGGFSKRRARSAKATTEPTSETAPLTQTELPVAQETPSDFSPSESKPDESNSKSSGLVRKGEDVKRTKSKPSKEEEAAATEPVPKRVPKPSWNATPREVAEALAAPAKREAPKAGGAAASPEPDRAPKPEPERVPKATLIFPAQVIEQEVPPSPSTAATQPFSDAVAPVGQGPCVRVRLDYDVNQSLLRVVVHSAGNMPSADDYYAKVYLLPDVTRTSKRKTLVRKSTTNPVFDQAFDYPVPAGELSQRIVRVSLWRHGDLRNSAIGESQIALDDLGEVAGKLTWYSLGPSRGRSRSVAGSKPGSASSSRRGSIDSMVESVHALDAASILEQPFDDAASVHSVSAVSTVSHTGTVGEVEKGGRGGRSAKSMKRKKVGRLELELSFAFTKAQLTVNVLRVVELTESEFSAPPRLYVKTYLTPDAKKVTKRKTGLSEASFAPVFNEKIVYEAVDPDALEDLSLRVVLMHDGSMTHSEVGEVSISLAHFREHGAVRDEYVLTKAASRRLSLSSRHKETEEEQPASASETPAASAEAASETPTAAPASITTEHHSGGILGVFRRRSNSVSSTKSAVDDDARSIKSLAAGERGELHLAIAYDEGKGELSVTVKAAQSLRPVASNGQADPYVKLHLVPDAKGNLRAKTRTIHKTLDPQFDEIFTFPVKAEDLYQQRLFVSVFDYDVLQKDKFLGQVVVDLVELKPGEVRDEWFELKASALGNIKLALEYEDKKLTVHVREAKGLPVMNNKGTADTYAKLYIVPDKSKSTKRKTAIKHGTLRPNFDEKFVYTLTDADNAKTLQVSLWDAAIRAQCIGTVDISIESIIADGKMTQWFPIFNETGSVLVD